MCSRRRFAIPVAAECWSEVSAGDGHHLAELMGRFLFGGLHNRVAVELSSLQHADDIGVKPSRAVQNRTRRRCSWFQTGHGMAGTTNGSLAETQLVADPLTGRVEGRALEFIGVHVEHEHDRADFQGVGRTEEPAGHPLLSRGQPTPVSWS